MNYEINKAINEQMLLFEQKRERRVKQILNEELSWFSRQVMKINPKWVLIFNSVIIKTPQPLIKYEADSNGNYVVKSHIESSIIINGKEIKI